MLTFDPQALDRLVQRATTELAQEIDPMPGGASTRRYFRVANAKGSFVAMFVPDATPEEVTSGGPGTRWPFLEVRDLLEARGIRVPRVLGEDCDAGLILIEDLGDVTLAAFLEQAAAEGRLDDRRASIYRRAVTDLAGAQRALRELPEGSIVATRGFDEALLRWELDHFREWGLDARDRPLSPEDRAAFDAIADRLARRIAAWPRGFVHRDYQSRNLMVQSKAHGGEELIWIDFQDALLGPRVYDLVALLNDSYQTFDRAFTEDRINDFADASGLGMNEREALRREFDVMTVQRKLKDAGRFVFIDRVKKNPSFLPYVEPTLAKVRAALERLSDEDDMRELARLIRGA